LRDFSTKIQFLQYGDFKFNNIVEKFLKYNIAITGKKGTSTVQKRQKKMPEMAKTITKWWLNCLKIMNCWKK